MKKGILIVLALCLAFSVAVYAEGEGAAAAPAKPEYGNCLYSNIYPWFILWANIGYERMLGSIISLKVSYSNFMGMNAVGGEILFHPMNKGLEGFYVGPKYDCWLISGGSETAAINWLGGIAGYAFMFEGGVVLKLGVGYLFNLAGSVATLGTFEFFDKWPAVDLGIGWAF